MDINFSYSYSTPAFGDLDKDGDLDLVVGNSDGKIYAYRNNGNSDLSPQDRFERFSLWDSEDVGYYSDPTLGDLDKDGYLDLMIGNNNWEIRYYKNVFNKETQDIDWQRDTDFELSGISKFLSPELADFNNDGYLDLLVGNQNSDFDGQTFAFENVSIFEYEPQGTYTSPIYNLQEKFGLTKAAYELISWTDNGKNTITVKVRSGKNSDLSDAPSFDTCNSLSNGQDMSLSNCVQEGDQYVQFQAILSTSDTTVSPELKDITLRFNSGEAALTSSWFNTQNPENVIQSLEWTASVSSGTSLRFQLQTAPDNSGLPGTPSEWMGSEVDNGALSYYTTSGESINFYHRDDTSDQWMRYRVYFDSLDDVSTPELYSVRIKYSEGEPILPPDYDCVSVSGFTNTVDSENSGSILFSDLKDRSDVLRTCIDNQPYEMGDTLADWRFHVRGWSFDDNLGWISFDCSDWDTVSGVSENAVCDATDNYGTSIDFWGYFHGYAWSTKAGWIQFDWNLDGCSEGDYGASCGLGNDTYFAEMTNGGNIPLGRSYDDYSAINKTTCSAYKDKILDRDFAAQCTKRHNSDYPTTDDIAELCGGADPLAIELNPACEDSQGRGHFYGYAWNPTVGWFDFGDAWGIEDSFCSSDNYDSELCGTIWVPYRLEMIAKFEPSSGTDSYVFADSNEYFKMMLKLKDDLAGQVKIQKLEINDIDPENTLKNDQLNDQFIDGITSSQDLVKEENLTPLTGDDADSDGFFDTYHLSSFAPSSYGKGYDRDNDGVIDIYYDNDPYAYRYAFADDSIEFSNVEIEIGDTGALATLPVARLYFLDALSPDGYLDLGFSPAFNIKGILNEGNHFINTWRNNNTHFDMLLEKTPNFNICNETTCLNAPKTSIQLGVGSDDYGTKMLYDFSTHQYGDRDYEDKATVPYHLVFDAENYQKDYFDSENGNGTFDYWNDLPETFVTFTQELFDSFVGKASDLLSVPVINPDYPEADEVVTSPSLDIWKVQYGIPKDGSIINILYKGDELGPPLAEGIQNPVANIQGVVSISNRTINAQTGQYYESIGDIQTNILRNTILKNVSAIKRGVEFTPTDSTCYVDDYAHDRGISEAQPTGDGSLNLYNVDDFGAVNGDCFSGRAITLNNASEPTAYYFKGSENQSAAFQVVLKDRDVDENIIDFGDTPKSVICEGCNIFIDSNLWGVQSQIGLIALRDGKGYGGNIYVHPDVTNIRAVIYADSIFTSYDGTKNNVLLSESLLDKDLDGDGSANRAYPVPDVSSWECQAADGNTILANPEAVLHNQLRIDGAITSTNTIGGSDSILDGELKPLLGTGERLEASEEGIAIAKMYDLNFLRYFKPYLKRNALDHIRDWQCEDTVDVDGQIVTFSDGLYFGGTETDENGDIFYLYYDIHGNLVSRTLEDDVPSGCNGVDATTIYENGGDLVVRSQEQGFAPVCGTEDKLSFAIPDEQNFASIYFIYEPPKNLPGFELDLESGQSTQTNR